MAVHVVDIGAPELEDIDSYVREGRFRSVDAFVEVAVRNQLVLERRHGRKRGDGATGPPFARLSAAPAGSTLGPFDLAIANVACEPLAPTGIRSGPLFGQYYRFLPLKVVLRALAADAVAGSWPIMAAAAPRVAAIASQFGHALRDKSNDSAYSIATGFPSDERDASKSRARFEAQYVGRVRADGQCDGFGFALGFIGSGDSKAGPTVGLTTGGIEFAAIRNPAIDEHRSEALAAGETRFLWNWLRDRVPDEFAHANAVLSSVRNGANTPGKLAEEMGAFYRDRFGDEQWTDSKISLTRSGAVSRLVEMQLLAPTKEGTRVSYAVIEQRLAALNEQ